MYVNFTKLDHKLNWENWPRNTYDIMPFLLHTMTYDWAIKYLSSLILFVEGRLVIHNLLVLTYISLGRYFNRYFSLEYFRKKRKQLFR